MEKTKEEMLAIIRKVIGNKRFMFEADYPKVGNGMEICAITQQKVFFTSKVLIRYYYVEETDSYSAKIDKLSICRRFDGFIKSNLKLDDLSIGDLRSLYNGLIYYLWWENNVRLPEIRKQLTECEKKAKMYAKLEKLV